MQTLTPNKAHITLLCLRAEYIQYITQSIEETEGHNLSLPVDPPESIL